MAKNFSYIHVEKLTEWGRGTRATRSYRQAKYTRNWGVQGCWEHDMRLIETPNADARKLSLNGVACAETAWQLQSLDRETIQKIGADDPAFIAKKAQTLIRDRGISVRKDQVKVAMLMLAVSPEFLRDGENSGPLNDEKVQKWMESSLNFLRKKFGDRLLSAVVHFDEANPHMSAYIVPLIEKDVRSRGRRPKHAKHEPKKATRQLRLSCKSLFTCDPYEKRKTADGKVQKVVTGKGTCSQLQDDYGEHLQTSGLEIRRGVRRAPFQKALQHETNRIRYGRLSAPIADVANMDHGELLLWAIDTAPQAEEQRRAKIERDHYQIAAADAQERVEQLERALRDQQRSLPVADVIAKLFAIEPFDSDDSSAHFLLPTGQKVAVQTNLNRFENLTPELALPGEKPRNRGRGAIDAVTILTGWKLDQATLWIADNFGTQEAKRSIGEMVELALEQTAEDPKRAQRAEFAKNIAQELEQPDSETWEKTVAAACKLFQVPRHCLEKMRSEKWLEANKFGHLLFTKGRWDETGDIVPTGKIIIDLRNPEIRLKETGDNGLVILPRAGRAKNAILCSNPLDGLALGQHPDTRGDYVFVVGKPSACTVPQIKKILEAYQGRIRLAEDVSAIGRLIAGWFKENFPQIPSLKLPDGINSWLEHHLKQEAEKNATNIV